MNAFSLFSFACLLCLFGLASSQTLSSLISTSKFTVTGGLIRNSDYEWGPYIRQIRNNGDIKIAWIDTTMTKIYVHHLDSNLATKYPPTLITGYNKLSSFEAHADGRTVVLAVNTAGCPDTTCFLDRNCTKCLDLKLIEISSTGLVTRTSLIDDRFFKQDGKYACSGIAIGDYKGMGETYAIMRSVRGATNATVLPGGTNFCGTVPLNSGHQWHETWIYNATTMEVIVSGCGLFPCGHSLGLKQIAYHPTTKTFGSTCIGNFKGGPSDVGFRFIRDSEAYKAKTIYNSWRSYPNFQSPGNSAEVVPIGTDSFMVAVQMPRLVQTDLQDLMVVKVKSDGTILGGPWWYAPLAGVVNPHIAKYGDNFVIGWQSVTGNYLAVIREDGSLVAGPELISGKTKFSMTPRWITRTDGSVMWIRYLTTNSLEIVKLATATGISGRGMDTTRDVATDVDVCGNGIVEGSEECDVGPSAGECTPHEGEFYCVACSSQCKWVKNLVAQTGLDLALLVSEADKVSTVSGISAPAMVSGCAKVGGTLYLRSAHPLTTASYNILFSESDCVEGQFEEVVLDVLDPLEDCYDTAWEWDQTAAPQLRLTVRVTKNEQCIALLSSMSVTTQSSESGAKARPLTLSSTNVMIISVVVCGSVLIAAVATGVGLYVRKKKLAALVEVAKAQENSTENAQPLSEMPKV